MSAIAVFFESSWFYAVPVALAVIIAIDVYITGCPRRRDPA